MDGTQGFVPLPDRVHRLDELAGDLWWSWQKSARAVFRGLDYALWRSTAHNPVQMLRTIAPERLAEAAEDAKWLALYDTAIAGLDAAHDARNTWAMTRYGELSGRTIAYFSAEFALHQSLPIYAGGLGVLAGDHCKESSDLGVPLVGVGFMYPQGYFHQSVSAEGWQVEVYERLNRIEAPVEPALTPDGRPAVTAVPLGERTVLVAIWRIRLGRVSLYLLDTDLEENAPWDRELSARLYGGDRETRIQQEIVLGIGGVRALSAVGIQPAVWHLNEGHAAFVVLQRIRELIERGVAFDRALEEVRQTTVFTTHTPVPAGHDAFPFHLVETHLAGCWGSLGSYRDRFLALGEHDSGGGPQFNMTALAVRTANAVNGVSRLHGQVTRDMWASVLEPRSKEGAQLLYLTNGVHVPTWVSAEMAQLFERHLGFNWRDRHDEPEFWNAVGDIPDEEVWAVRQALRTYLFHFIRERARDRWSDERVSAGRVVAAGTLLDPSALTVGFARRFTGYKRPELLFHDPARLAGLLSAPRRPIQLLFAGKSHPADDIGKHHLQRVFKHALDPAFAGRIAFVDDYDLHVAHFLVQGCDVWLNTPRKPLEASGTSGMKAAINGTLHLSIGDGWWAEGYDGSNGWLIDGARADDPSAQDANDAAALYTLLEERIVPAFYDRDETQIPRTWVRFVKEAIRSITPQFSARRMVKQYVERMYLPAVRNGVTK